MGAFQATQPALIEPIAVPDIFACGMSDAEPIGEGNYRFTFFTNQRPLNGGPNERVVCARLVLPATAAKDAARLALTVLGGNFKRN